uniref:ShKT domain-containing protein n=1 Tax=Romanomermis culicivorax TaxID=13658 RepID=A0A915HSA7_ROMCU
MPACKGINLEYLYRKKYLWYEVARFYTGNAAVSNACSDADCCDQHEWCEFWASTGQCRTNSDFMAKTCKLSCNACGIS